VIYAILRDVIGRISNSVAIFVYTGVVAPVVALTIVIPTAIAPMILRLDEKRFSSDCNVMSIVDEIVVIDESIKNGILYIESIT